ncbi:hypothetical protein [Sciscionella marina]|uniref:hypothetical protein n=1 Tax=Sciscionella marina TaxID=508770 RepID=UPI00035C79D9|nr:hypothetical protein [Sciscionella marina]
MIARRILRGGLALLTLTQLAVGLVALFLPHWFFSFPVVGMGMAYNPHLMMDYGAMGLATCVVLGTAVFRLRLARLALLVYLVFAVAHFGIHVRFIDCLSPATATGLLVVLGFAIAIPLGLLALTRQSSPSSSASTTA